MTAQFMPHWAVAIVALIQARRAIKFNPLYLSFSGTFWKMYYDVVFVSGCFVYRSGAGGYTTSLGRV